MPWAHTIRSLTGAMDLARIFNRNYVIGKITKTEVWSPVTAYYDNLPVPGSGIMRANSPWSGHYEVPPTVWITAHTTQFARPGWKYLEHACKLIPGGSVVALASPDGGDYSVVIETMDADHPQKLSFRVADAWANRPLHVWRTNAREYFKEIQSILPQNGAFTMAVDTQSVYSVTTAIGQCKGGALPPPAKPFPFPYREDFEGYEAGVTPRYLSDQAGIFEVVKRTDGTGMALLQVISEKGIEWPGHFNPAPESFLGSSDWRDYEISVDTLIEKAGFVSLFGRVGRIPQSFDPPDGYRLKVSENGEWQFDVVKNLSGKMQNPASTIGAGKVSFAADQWHRLKLRFSGDIIRVVIDNKPVAEIKDATYPAGMVGIGGGWHGAQFDNLTVSAVDEVSR